MVVDSSMNRPTLAFRFQLLFFLIAVSLICQLGISRAETAGEYQVKAAFFYHFANFVDWPESTFKATKGHIRICVMGKDLFGQTLNATLAKKTVRDHPFEIHQNPPKTELQHCHVLYLSATRSSQMKALHHQIAKSDVLTVGENLEFMRHGGMVQFFVDNQKVRFAVNTDIINQTHLKVSSKLLRLAKNYTP